jgi:ribonucleoside-triphosphate reductase
LDNYAVGSHNCLSIPFDKLLAKGFNTRQTDIRPANSINTAFQLLAVIFQLQSLQQFGGCSATHLDWTMVPYVRKSFKKHWNDGAKYIGCLLNHFPSNWENVTEDLPLEDYPDYDDCSPVYNYALNLTIKELKQAVEAMYHNLNSLQSRSGN